MAKKTIQLECHDCETILTIVIDSKLTEITEDDIKYCPVCKSKDNISLD